MKLLMSIDCFCHSEWVIKPHGESSFRGVDVQMARHDTVLVFASVFLFALQKPTIIIKTEITSLKLKSYTLSLC